MSRIVRLKPVNRHLLIIPHSKKEETSTGVVLPEGYEPDQTLYVEATVIDVAPDCKRHFNSMRHGMPAEERRIIVEKSMIQEVKVKEKTHYLILENYVIGVYRGPNED